jgi:hypothetical protein
MNTTAAKAAAAAASMTDQVSLMDLLECLLESYFLEVLMNTVF